MFGMLAAGCQTDPVQQEDELIPICIALSQTKVAGDSFETGDAVGIFVVNATGNGDSSWLPGVLAQKGNHLDNVRFTYSGTWTSDKEYYWKDSVTPAEFYCYFPYTGSIGDIENVHFTAPSDQSSAEAFRSAEILWGKTGLTEPVENCVNINTTHMMSQLVLEVLPGKGFTKETLAASIQGIEINGIRCGASLNIKTGSLTCEGEEVNVTPYYDGTSYRALIVPQKIDGRTLVTLYIDGMKRTLAQTVEFTSNSKKKCTLTINKINEGINVGIGGWENDETDYGGILN